jgi:hypothetical protein
VRSRITVCALAGSLHSSADSASAFSSARRTRAWSRSKRPPQQRERLLDLFDMGGCFGAHGGLADEKRAEMYAETRQRLKNNVLGNREDLANRFRKKRLSGDHACQSKPGR